MAPSTPRRRGSKQHGRPAKAARPDPRIGTVFARVHIREVLGKGASAVVYGGVHEGLGIDVALKVLRPKAAAVPTVVEAFAREGRAIARIDHENVLKVYDVVSEGDLHGMVVELLEGEEVLDLVARREHLSQIDALRILRQAAAGLAAVHAKGIVHRDVKPQNLVVKPDGTVKLVDFGLALTGEAAKKRVGTPHYLAPETCRSGHAETASDVYSLGVTFFHLLVGQPPYAGMSVQEVMRAHIEGRPMDLEGRRPELARPVRALFQRLTKPDPLMRPTAAEVVAEVDRFGGKRLRRKKSLRTLRGAGAGGRVAAVAGAVVVLAGIGLLLALRGEGDDEESARRAKAASEPPPAPRPPPPPTITPEERAEVAARLAAEEERRQRLEAEARRLLEGAEAWARAHWTTRADTARVVRRYEQVSGEYRKTEAAAEARRRAEEIEAGVLHPHPDRAWTPPEEVEAARAALSERRAAIDELLAASRFAEAKAALPAPVSDPSGELEAELGFQHAFLDALVAFPAALAARLEADPAASRRLATRHGEGEVRTLDETGFTLRIEGREVTVPWPEVEPRSVAGLALRLFESASAKELTPLLAFCVAHGLRNAFWQVSIGLDRGRLTPAEEAFVRALESRLP